MQITAALLFSIATLSAGAFAAPTADQAATGPAEAGQDAHSFDHGSSLGHTGDSFASHGHGHHFDNDHFGHGHLGDNGLTELGHVGHVGGDHLSDDFASTNGNFGGSDLFDDDEHHVHGSGYNHHGRDRDHHHTKDHHRDTAALSYREDPARYRDHHHTDAARDNHRENASSECHHNDAHDAGSHQHNDHVTGHERDSREHDNKSEYELGFGYKRGSKYDNGYGYSRGYDYGRDRKADEASAEGHHNEAERRPQHSHEDDLAARHGEKDKHGRKHYDDAHANRERGRNFDGRAEHRRNRGEHRHSDEEYNHQGGSFGSHHF